MVKTAKLILKNKRSLEAEKSMMSINLSVGINSLNKVMISAGDFVSYLKAKEIDFCES